MNKASHKLETRPPISNNVVEVKGVWKKFSKTRSGARRNMLSKTGRAFFGLQPGETILREDEFWAVQDLSFELQRGKTLGILGLNGAGKTTVLNMIGGMMLPDKGQITTVGAIGALMNLAAGFQPSLSAYENILIGGAVRGWSMEETEKRVPDIISFAELGEHLSRRLADFSAGMRLRLAFSIAVHMQPDLLLIDEVLAVGDHRFRAKCQEKINSMREDASVIIVSHSVRDIREYCDECLLIKDGVPVFKGDVEEGLSLLLESYHKGSISAGSVTKAPVENKPVAAFISETDLEDAVVSSSKNKADKSERGRELVVNYFFKTITECDALTLGVAIRSIGSDPILSGISSINEMGELHANAGQKISAEVVIDTSVLNPGRYSIEAVIANADKILFQGSLDTYEVFTNEEFTWGPVALTAKWQVG
ncbi:MAG: ABC transporter ATP-binding protein [Hyphomonadaceae bacterium]|nr:ABC transporter ATP-binding protein [Hyphomonadaceae bacterium]